jgi:hypothetical protein
MINKSIVQRARDLGSSICFADETMQCALAAQSVSSLTPQAIFNMRESWWRYHISRWANGTDSILADLSRRLLNRRLFKTVRIETPASKEQLLHSAEEALRKLSLDPTYYLHEVSTADVHAGDSKQSMLVQLDDGSVITLAQADPLFQAMAIDSRLSKKTWIALPQEAKRLLGYSR